MPVCGRQSYGVCVSDQQQLRNITKTENARSRHPTEHDVRCGPRSQDLGGSRRKAFATCKSFTLPAREPGVVPRRSNIAGITRCVGESFSLREKVAREERPKAATNKKGRMRGTIFANTDPLTRPSATLSRWERGRSKTDLLASGSCERRSDAS